MARYCHRCYTESILYSNLFVTVFILFLFGTIAPVNLFSGNNTGSFIKSFYLYTAALIVALSFVIILITLILGKLFQLMLLFTGIVSTNSVESIALHPIASTSAMEIAQSVMTGFKSLLWIPVVYIVANKLATMGYPIIGTHYVYNPFSFMTGPVYYQTGQGPNNDTITDVFSLEPVTLVPGTAWSKFLQAVFICIFGLRLLSPGGIITLVLLYCVGLYSATPKATVDKFSSNIESTLFDWSHGLAVDDGVVAGVIRRLLSQFIGLDTWIMNPHLQNERLAISVNLWNYMKWLIGICVIVYVAGHMEMFGQHIALTGLSVVLLIAIIGFGVSGGLGLTGTIRDLIVQAWTAIDPSWSMTDINNLYTGLDLDVFTDFVKGYTGGNFIQQVDKHQINCRYGDIRIMPDDMAAYIEQLRKNRDPETEKYMRYCRKWKFESGKQTCPYSKPVAGSHPGANTAQEYVQSVMPQGQQQGGGGGGDGDRVVPIHFSLKIRNSNTLYPLRGLRGFLETNELETDKGQRVNWTDDNLRRIVEERMQEIENTYGNRYMPKQFIDRE